MELLGQSSGHSTGGLGINHHERSHTQGWLFKRITGSWAHRMIDDEPRLSRMLLVQILVFFKSRHHFLQFANNHVLSFNDQLVLDARDDYLTVRRIDTARRLAWLL